MKVSVPYLLAPFVFAAGPAMAQDASNFVGPRVEAIVGWNQLRFDLSHVGDTGRAKTSDLTYGGEIGYDFALRPNLVAGVAVGATGSDGKYLDANSGDTLRQRRELNAAVRLGTPLTASTLLYGKVGYSNLQVGLTQPTARGTTGGTRDLDGVLAAVGLEVKISRAAYIKSEYRYTDYASGYSTNAVTTGLGIRF